METQFFIRHNRFWNTDTFDEDKESFDLNSVVFYQAFLRVNK